MKDWESMACGVAGRNLSGPGVAAVHAGRALSAKPVRTSRSIRAGSTRLTMLARTQQAAGNTDEAKTTIGDGLQWSWPQRMNGANNSMCWFGSLSGFAAQVMPACERAGLSGAVEHAWQNWRDSRGVARAITGDYAGAIEDFQGPRGPGETERAV